MSNKSFTYGEDEDFIFPNDLDKIKPSPIAVFKRILLEEAQKQSLDREEIEIIYCKAIEEIESQEE